MEIGRLSAQGLYQPEEAQGNIKVPMSDQSAVPMTDTASQLNDPAPQSSPVQTDEEKVFCDTSKEQGAGMGNKQWYVARCTKSSHGIRPLYEEILNNYPQFELYWPQKTTKKGKDDKKIIVTPILSSYLFIRSDISLLQKLFEREDIRSLGFLMKRHSHDGASQYVMVRDSEMLKFKWVCDNHFNSLVVIDHQTTQLRDGLKVRITDGLLKDKEGVIIRHNGSRSFAVRFDNVFPEEAQDDSDETLKALSLSGFMVFRVTKSLQQNMEVIGDDRKTKNMYSVMALVDMLQSHVRSIKDASNKYPYFHASAQIINALILYRLYHSPLLSSDLLKKYRWMSRKSEVQEKSTRTKKLKPRKYVPIAESTLFPELEQVKWVMGKLKDFHLEALDFLVQYAIINLERELSSSAKPMLSNILLQGQISPFITYRTSHNKIKALNNHLRDNFVEYVFKVDVAEIEDSVHSTLSSPTESQQTEKEANIDYYAHVGIFRKEDGSYILITNWSSFQEVIDKFRMDILDDEPENVNKRLLLDKMPTFASVLNENNTSNVTFGTHEGIYGTMIQISEDADESCDSKGLPAIVQKKMMHLTDVSITVLQEIWSSTQYELRKNLPKVWIRPVD